jgi:tetratricopeptide (TPR) repeat protein
LDPRLAAAWLNRGVIAFDCGEFSQAIADFERALRLDPRDQGTLGRLHYNLALAWWEQGARAQARTHAEEAVRLGFADATSVLTDLRAGRAVKIPMRRKASGSSWSK